MLHNKMLLHQIISRQLAEHLLEQVVLLMLVELVVLVDKQRNKRYLVVVHNGRSINQQRNYKILHAFSNRIPNHFCANICHRKFGTNTKINHANPASHLRHAAFQVLQTQIPELVYMLVLMMLIEPSINFSTKSQKTIMAIHQQLNILLI